MNKTQQNQPVYKNIEPRCPGTKGKRGCTDCSGSNTNVGCRSCWGCTYTFDVSSVAFRGAYPSYGSFVNVNLLVDSSNNPPCEWQFNAIVEGFSFYSNDPSNTRVAINIEDNKCVGDISGVYFYPPVGGNTGTYVGWFKDCNTGQIQDISGHEMTTPVPHKFVTTAKRMGAPYRNPIAGWRRTLDCCEEPCFVTLTQTGVTGVAITRGVSQYSQTQQDGTICTGTITDYYPSNQSTSPAVDLIRITVQLDNCCCIPFARAGHITGGIDQTPSPYEFIATNVVVISRETSGAAKQPTNTVYKDRYSGGKDASGGGCGACAVDCTNTLAPRSGNAARTYRPIIRSGMQEKRPCCIDSNGKCNKTNDYSFSYWQYKHNKRCLDYERNLEKYVGRYPACVNGVCQNAYRKASCCDCDCDNCSQLIRNLTTGLFIYAPQIGDNAIQTNTGATGIVISFTTGGGMANDIDTVTIQATDCENLFQSSVNGGIVFSGSNSSGYTLSQRTMNPFTILSEMIQKRVNCSSKAMAKTIYKPSNKKFSHQGAVTSGGRLERLKLDTIKSANSRCTKNAPRKCIEIQSKFVGLNKIYKYPNGKYGAGKPRFTGWMFNGHHQEVKSRVYNMVRYNQQPLGIPQLTAHRLTLSQGGNGCGPKQCFPRTLNLGSNRPTAAGNRARIPGAICNPVLTCNCLPTEDNNLTIDVHVGGNYTFWGYNYGTGGPVQGALIPNTIDSSGVTWMGWQIGGDFDEEFYINFSDINNNMPQNHFDSISFVNCAGNDISVRTYYTDGTTYHSSDTNGGDGRPTWRWNASESGYSIASESAYWAAAVGQTLKVYIDNVPQLGGCECCCTNLQYQTGQGVPCC